jgi:hypothetical protein
MTTFDISLHQPTQRVCGPIARDTDTTPRDAFGIVDPATTGTLTDLAQIAIALGRRAELQTAARIAAERRMGPPGRHRRPKEPGWFARLLQTLSLGRLGGAR